MYRLSGCAKEGRALEAQGVFQDVLQLQESVAVQSSQRAVRERPYRPTSHGFVYLPEHRFGVGSAASRAADLESVPLCSLLRWENSVLYSPFEQQLTRHPARFQTMLRDRYYSRHSPH